MNSSEIFSINGSRESILLELNAKSERDPLLLLVPLTVIYLLILISGFIGNIITCIVIRNNRCMHTNTNYYLFSLAISDFILLVTGVPQELYYIWFKYHSYMFGEYFCIGRGLIAETSANATVLTITAFTMERYAAICHPFVVQTKSKLRRAIRLIVLIWLLALIGAIPQAAQFGVVIHQGIRKCTIVRVVVEHSFQLSTYVFFFVPMFIILVLYILIGWHLHKSHGDDTLIIRRHQNHHKTVAALKATQSDTILYRYVGDNGNTIAARKQLRQISGRRTATFGNGRVLKMLVAVVICFFLCWAPFHAQRLNAVYGSKSRLVSITSFNNTDDDGNKDIDNYNVDGHFEDHHVFIYSLLMYCSGILYYLSTCINPLLYNLMSNKFRQAFKSTLFHMKLRNARHMRPKIKEYLNTSKIYYSGTTLDVPNNPNQLFIQQLKQQPNTNNNNRIISI